MFAIQMTVFMSTVLINAIEFALVVGDKGSLKSRIERGCNSSISVQGEFLLKQSGKADLGGGQLLNEYATLLKLNKLKFPFCPKLHPEWLEFKDIDAEGIKMSLVDNGASLGDWVIAFCEKKVSQKTLQFLIKEVKASLKKLNDLGVNHNDFHEDNILVDWSPEKGFQIVIIDYGHASKKEPFPGADLDTLKEGINFILVQEDIPQDIRRNILSQI